jgi:hypothetical protein
MDTDLYLNSYLLTKKLTNTETLYGAISFSTQMFDLPFDKAYTFKND